MSEEHISNQERYLRLMEEFYELRVLADDRGTPAHTERCVRFLGDAFAQLVQNERKNSPPEERRPKWKVVDDALLFAQAHDGKLAKPILSALSNLLRTAQKSNVIDQCTWSFYPDSFYAALYIIASELAVIDDPNANKVVQSRFKVTKSTRIDWVNKWKAHLIEQESDGSAWFSPSFVDVIDKKKDRIEACRTLGKIDQKTASRELAKLEKQRATGVQQRNDRVREFLTQLGSDWITEQMEEASTSYLRNYSTRQVRRRS